MKYIIIANVIATIASLIMIYSGFIENKKKFLIAQNTHVCIQMISNLLLNGISGVVNNILTIIRNVLSYHNKLNFLAKTLITILSIVLTVVFNNIGFIGLFPLIASILYIWYMNTPDIVKLKILNIVTLILWLFYDFTIMSYSSVIFEILTIVSNSISIYKISKNRKH